MDFQNNRSVYVIVALHVVVFLLLVLFNETLQDHTFIFPILMPLFVGFFATYMMAYKNTVTKQECFWTSLVALCAICIVFILKNGFNEFISDIQLPRLNFIFSLLVIFGLMYCSHWLSFQFVKSKIIKSKIDDEITLNRYFRNGK